jgi:hypothetical protein
MPLIARKSYLKNERFVSAKQVLSVLPIEMHEIASRVSAYGLSEGRRRSLGMVGQMASELIEGAATLFEKEMWYGGAALVRQVVEIEYILFLFADDPSEADQWIEKKQDQARSYFSPVAMRERSKGRFNAAEYSTHCGIGGHPRKQGVLLLRDWVTVIDGTADEELIPVALWVDLALHAIRIWGHFTDCVKSISSSNVYPDKIERIEKAIADASLQDP